MMLEKCVSNAVEFLLTFLDNCNVSWKALILPYYCISRICLVFHDIKVGKCSFFSPQHSVPFEDGPREANVQTQGEWDSF